MKIVGLDIGTTSVCGVCIDADTGKLLQVCNRPNNANLSTAFSWQKQQDAEKLVGIVQDILQELLAQQGTVDGIGVTGQMHGIVYVNAQGKAVSPLTTWQDGSGNELYQNGKTYAQWLTEQTGMALATGYGGVTHFYNTVNNAVPADAVAFCTIHDYVVMTLTGRTTPLVHPSDGASFGFYDLNKHCFDIASVEKVGMDVSYFPEIANGYVVAGKTKEGIPVSVAIGDNQASVVGSLQDMERSILINVGTGSQISCVVKEVPENSTLDCRPLVDGHYLLAGSSLCGGRAYAILERFLRETAQCICGTPVTEAYSAMNQAMEEYAEPAEPLIVDTAFSGTRSDPTKRGSIIGISIDNLTMANLCHGVMNGMAEELHTLYAQMKPFIHTMPDRIIGSGNGIRKNKYLQQQFAKKFAMPMEIPFHTEEAAFGAALFAMVACGVAASMADAQQCIQYLQ